MHYPPGKRRPTPISGYSDQSSLQEREKSREIRGHENSSAKREFFFIFYSELIDTYWVIPSLDLIKEANQNKTGANKGKYSIVFVNITKTGGKRRSAGVGAENAFHQLEIEQN